MTTDYSSRSDRGPGRAFGHFCLTALVLHSVLQCVQAASPTTMAAAAVHRWSLAELSVTSSELPKQIPAPPYPTHQQRVQSTPHYDQQLKLPSGNGGGPEDLDGHRRHRRRRRQYPWTRFTPSTDWDFSTWAGRGRSRNRASCLKRVSDLMRKIAHVTFF